MGCDSRDNWRNHMFLAFLFIDGNAYCWTWDDGGRGEGGKKIKVEGVDDSVMT